MRKSEILSEGLSICELACTLRKNIASHKKELDHCETDEDVIAEDPQYWDEKLSQIETKVKILSSHIKENTNWSFFDFWSKQMKHAVDFDKEIHFFPNRVIKFIDWARFAINNSLKND